MANNNFEKLCEGDLLTSPQAASLIGVHTLTLARWRREKHGPKFIKVTERKILYPKKDLIKWISNRIYEYEKAR